jgi:hypothetical protein
VRKDIGKKLRAQVQAEASEQRYREPDGDQFGQQRERLLLHLRRGLHYGNNRTYQRGDTKHRKTENRCDNQRFT